jgi:hypothetical protein
MQRTRRRGIRAYLQFADLLAKWHKIIGNNWQNAATARLPD